MATGSTIPSNTDFRPQKFHASNTRGGFLDFRSPIAAAVTCDTPYGAPTGTGGDVNNLTIGGYTWQYHILGTQTILAPTRTSAGLNITQDLTNNDGVEHAFSIVESPANTVVGALGNGAFTVGTDKPFYASCKFTLADVSGTDDCAFGFRKMEAFQANIDDYNDAAWINAISGDMKIETILANAATTTTDTTQNWLDTETHRFTVIVDSNGSLGSLTSGAIGNGTVGQVFYEIDGARPTTLPTTAFKFASASVLIPFFYLLNDTDVAEATTLVEVEWGFVGAGNTAQLATQSSS